MYRKYTNEYLGKITGFTVSLYQCITSEGEKIILLPSDQNKSWYVKNPGEIDVTRLPEPGKEKYINFSFYREIKDFYINSLRDNYYTKRY